MLGTCHGPRVLQTDLHAPRREAPTTQEVGIFDGRAHEDRNVSINVVGLGCRSGDFALAQADKRRVPLVFRRHERDEQDHSSDPCVRRNSRSKLAGL